MSSEPLLGGQARPACGRQAGPQGIAGADPASVPGLSSTATPAVIGSLRWNEAHQNSESRSLRTWPATKRCAGDAIELEVVGILVRALRAYPVRMEAGYALLLSLITGRVRGISAARAVVVGRGCGSTHGRCTDGRSAYAWAVVAPAVIAAASRHGAASIRYAAASRYGTAAMRYSTAASRYGAAAGSARREGVSRNACDAHCGDHDK